MRRALLGAFVALVATEAHASAPCEGVERGESAPSLSARVAVQLHDPKAKALRTFAYDGWEIVEVALGDAQDAYVFYSADPLSSDTVAVWRGAKDLDGVSQAKEWTVESAPGIPNQLARCFAVRVTAGR
ncbi:MAG TPA: hypothetical protein VFV07_05045 [Rhizomicrobium sp.]|nr:hypothetical protein [Rhizomicrobium sp.]